MSPKEALRQRRQRASTCRGKAVKRTQSCLEQGLLTDAAKHAVCAAQWAAVECELDEVLHEMGGMDGG